VNGPPIGPRTSNWSGDRLVDEIGRDLAVLEASSKRSIVSSTASCSGAEAIEYERDAW
jgi:hypothetical protein